MKLLFTAILCLFLNNAFAIVELIDLNKLTDVQKKLWEKEFKKNPWVNSGKGYNVFTEDFVKEYKEKTQAPWGKVLKSNPDLYVELQYELLKHFENIQQSLTKNNVSGLNELNTLFVLSLYGELLDEQVDLANIVAIERRVLLAGQWQVIIAKLNAIEKKKKLDNSSWFLLRSRRNAYNQAQTRLTNVLKNNVETYNKYMNNAYDRQRLAQIFVSNIEDSQIKLDILLNKNLFNVDQSMISDEVNALSLIEGRDNKIGVIQQLNQLTAELNSGAEYDMMMQKKYNLLDTASEYFDYRKNSDLGHAFYRVMGRIVVKQLQAKLVMFELGDEEKNKIEAAIVEINDYLKTLEE